jgi:hypothetical protein
MRAFTAKGGQDGIEILNASELEAERGPEEPAQAACP